MLRVNVFCLNYLSAKNFIERLLQVDPKKRFTCKQALNHPWYVQFTNIRFIAFVVVFFFIIYEHAWLVNEGKVSKIHIFTEKSLVFFRHFSGLILTAA